MSQGSAAATNTSNLVNLGRMFYLIHPNAYMYQFPHEVPDYVVDAFPFFTAAIILEFLIMLLQGKNDFRIFYVFNNISGGLLQQTVNKLLIRPIMFIAYCYIYEYYRLYGLPWDSAWTWYFTFLAFDFAYYWFHRLSHEVNIIWAAHQIHHSSEDFNLTIAFRQSVLQTYFSGLIYLPLAILIPPSVFFVHAQFNLLYKFWIHSEVIGTLGPLEYILNTASHHRVHHGRNPYCIDKNYGGILIVWDRLFNTFAAESEPVAYGLVFMNETANPFLLQVNHYYHLFKRFRKITKWSDKIRCILRTPSWLAECERTGKSDRIVIPEVELPMQLREVKYFNMENRMETSYVFINFLLANVVFQEFFIRRLELSVPAVYTCLFYMFFTMTSFGYILEGRWFRYHLEVLRCFLVLAVDIYLTMNSLKNPLISETVMDVVKVINLISLLFVCFNILTNSSGSTNVSTNEKKVK